MARRFFAALVVLSICAAGGCGVQSWLLRAEQGILFQGLDTLARPGEEVALSIKLQAGDRLSPKQNYLVTFFHNDIEIGNARTNADGVAEISFRPMDEGNFHIEARLDEKETGLENPPVAQILVCCRKKDARLMVVDLDKTLVGSGFHTVLLGDPVPMEHSTEVMKRLSEDFTIIYLTHRPDYFGTNSKLWLKKCGYPEGPLLLSTLSEFFEGSGRYKSGKISEIKKAFPNLEIGIGDKASDARAYIDNGLKAYLVRRIEPGADKEDYDEMIEDIEAMPSSTEVVDGWKAIEESVFKRRKHTRDKMLQLLKELQRKAPR